MNRFCFLNRIANWLGWTQEKNGHFYDADYHNATKCLRCGIRR